jgi:hypothetical protein
MFKFSTTHRSRFGLRNCLNVQNFSITFAQVGSRSDLTKVGLDDVIGIDEILSKVENRKVSGSLFSKALSAVESLIEDTCPLLNKSIKVGLQ